MSVQFVEDADDPRVADYRDVRERDLTMRKGLCIAEGEVVLQTLLSPASLCRPRSVLIAAHRIDQRQALLACVPEGVPIYAASQEVLNRLVGFDLHRGILAVGEKPVPPALARLLATLPHRAVVLVASGIGNHDNMGGLFRNAAAFGAAAVLRDDRCCDPFYRKAIRVSVGAVLRTPSAAASSLDGLLSALAEHDFEVLALSPGATEPLKAVRGQGRQAILLGSEGPGLPPEVLAHFRTVGIAMAGGFDSLNVSTMAALALNQICDPPEA